MASSSQIASSSLHAAAAALDLQDESQESPAFPSLTPLSHDLDLLSPTQTPQFSVDDFLLSRTKASDLNFILSDLRSYSEKLKDELYSIINEDYKDFVSLGSSLKAEAHRIARLGWNARSTDAAVQDRVPSQGLMAPVRDTLFASRSMLKSVQDDIEDCIRRKEDATSHKAKLELMLQLHDSIVRLEDLLLIQHDKAKKDRRRSSHATRRPSVLSITSVRERRSSLASAVSGSDQELSDYAMSSEYDDDTDSEDDDDVGASSDELAAIPANGDGHQKRSRRKILRRLSSSTHNQRSPLHTRDSADPSGPPASPTKSRTDPFASTAGASSSSLLGLPQRIARTSAEYSRLRFLHRRIDEEHLSHFADALQDRIDNVRSVLRQDLRTLLRYLVSPESLLVHGQSSAKVPSSPELRKASRPPAPTARRTSFLQSASAKGQHATIHEQAANELDSWSQIPEPVEQGGSVEAAYWEARLEEQRSWLEMTLSTLNTLTLVAPQAQEADAAVKRRNEAEEAVRDLLVAEWADKTLVVDTDQQHTNSVSNPDSKELPPALQSQFEEHRAHVSSLLLTSDSPSPLLSLYNTLLTFVATTTWHVCDASREISVQTTSPAPQPSTAHDARCDIFTNVVWDSLSSRLLDTMGSTIFFVGQTDTFYANYTLTNAFLRALLSLAPEEAKAAVQAHPNWLAFKRGWQLPVYFQMRFREVVTELEARFGEGTREEEGCMVATKATLEAVERVWSEGVHVHELSAREWRVTLQILSRYRSWVEEQQPDGAVDATRASFDRSAVAAAVGEISRVSTPQPPADGLVQEREDEQLRFGVRLLADCLLLQSRMQVLLDSVILARIGAQLEADTSSLRSELIEVLRGECLQFIPGLAGAVGRMVFSVIFPRVASPLRLLRSSTPMRCTTGAPTVQVINSIFTPLHTFISTLPDLPTDTVRTWCTTILAETFKRYTATVETITKNQQSLIRLKKNQPGGLLGGLFSTGSALDVAELEKNFVESNRLALLTFEDKIRELRLDLDLDAWDAWRSLKAFLESDFDS